MRTLGLDIDGTITADPDFFVALTRRCAALGIRVIVVSSRSPLGREDTLHELRGIGLRFDDLFLTPSIEDARRLCPHADLDWFARHQWLKVDYALRQRISHFVDDDRRVLNLFARFAPHVMAVHADDRQDLVCEVDIPR